jgi:hypothetical protein
MRRGQSPKLVALDTAINGSFDWSNFGVVALVAKVEERLPNFQREIPLTEGE